MNEYLAWMDFETTGVKHDKLALLEVALVLTDMDLRPRVWYEAILEPAHMEFENDFVRDMHTRSGLRDALMVSGLDVREADYKLADLLGVHTEPESFIYMAGSGVAAFDRRLVADRMPELDACLHYRTYDVTQLERWLKKFRPERLPELPPDTEIEHRAMADVELSIRKAKALLEAMR